jgi:hypothetical protein
MNKTSEHVKVIEQQEDDNKNDDDDENEAEVVDSNEAKYY